MDINKIYSVVFPIGGIDDNNRYTELPGDKISTVQLLEPSVKVSDFNLTKKDTEELIDRMSFRIPLVSIDNYKIKQTDICDFKLDYTGFLPTLMFEFVDSSNSLLTTIVVKDGTIIKVYITGLGDGLYYKPIRQDFILTDIRKTAGEQQNRGNIFRYRVYGKLNIPYGYRRESWSAGDCSARQALYNLAIWTGLGFATNFTNTNTIDNMNWINSESGTYFDFIQDITAHACYSPNTFFTSFIDQYNVLNFVECHTLLSHGGNKADVPAMIYKCYPLYEVPEFDPEKDEKTTSNQIPLKDGDDPMNNSYQKLSYYFLSNNDFFDGWTNYIEEYYEITNSGSSLSDGFKTHVKYTDSNVGNFDINFSIRPIDNLKRDPKTQKIKSLPDQPTRDSYIPLNLMQIKNKEYLNEVSDVNNMTSVETFNNFGEVDTSNMFKQYFFAEVQNKYQMRCMKKCGLKVRLQNYNPSITKYSRIWVDIYDKNITSDLVPSQINANDSGTYVDLKNKINENLLYFEDEAKKDQYGKYNRSLSGWYVVTEMEIVYNPSENNLNMNLTLNRIEYRPIFKTEYASAKKAIEKYKNENKIEDILN